MTKLNLAGAGTGLLIAVAACSQVPDGASAQSSDGGQAVSGAQGVTIEAIEPVRAQPVDEQLVTCTHTAANGNKFTNFFVLVEGAAKSYSQFQNFARNLCDAGQPDCAQGWIGNDIASYSVNRNGVRNQYLLDLDALTMERALTTRDGTVEVSQYQCTTGDLPEGIVIE